MCIFLIRYFKKKLSRRFYSKYLPEHFVSPMQSLKLNVEARKPPTTYVSLRPVRAITSTIKVCLAEIAGPHYHVASFGPKSCDHTLLVDNKLFQFGQVYFNNN